MAGKKKAKSPEQELITRMQEANRRIAAEHDPYFGKRRSAGEMGRTKSRAAQSRQACRDRSLWA